MVDRKDFVLLEAELKQYSKKIFDMESVLYEKDEFERIALFERLFEAVRDVDRTRIKEQKYIETQVKRA